MTTTTKNRPDFDLDSQEFRTNPYPTYHAMRNQAPVYKCRDGKTYALTRYQDICTVLSNADLFSANLIGDAVGQNQPAVLIIQDPPRHGVLRKRMGRAFTPKYIRKLEEQIYTHAQRMVGDLLRLGECDFTEIVGRPLPVLVIGEIIGVPVNRHKELMRWSSLVIKGAIPAPGSAMGLTDLPTVLSNFAKIGFPLVRFTRKVGPRLMMDMARQMVPTTAKVFYSIIRSGSIREKKPTLLNLHDPSFPDSLRATLEFSACVYERVRHHRKHPDETVLDTLIEMVDENLISEWELLSNCIFLLVAGHETTVQLLNQAILQLTENPEMFSLLKSNPEMIGPFVDETLRFAPPLHWNLRRATKDVELGGTLIPAGSRVVSYLGAANRDPEIFDHPDTFDINRENASKHLAFGRGAHFCLGATLAKSEATAVLKVLTQSAQSINKTYGKQPRYIDTSFDGGLRGYSSVPVCVKA